MRVFFPHDPTTDLLDSIYCERFENEIAFSTLSHKKVGDSLGTRRVMYSTWFKHQLIEYDQYLIDTTLQNYIIGAALKARLTNSTDFRMNGSYVMAGYNAGDYQIVPKIHFASRDAKSTISLWIKIKEKQPDFLQQNYSSPNISWSNDFGKSLYQQAGASYTNIKHDLVFSAVGSRIFGFIYFDQSSKPQQLVEFVRRAFSYESLDIYQLSLSKTFHIRKWHATVKGMYQRTIGKKVLRLPMICGFGELYYENYLFKKVMLARIGLDVWYCSDFYADAWMPVTKQYHLQNYSQIGNYPFADVFLAFKIKSARVFIKWRHANAGLVSYEYYTTPRYPQPDNISTFLGLNTALRIGIDWTFMD